MVESQVERVYSGLSSLTKLQYLYLHENKLSGSIPSLSSLTRLIVLSLYENNLSGSTKSGHET